MSLESCRGRAPALSAERWCPLRGLRSWSAWLLGSGTAALSGLNDLVVRSGPAASEDVLREA